MSRRASNAAKPSRYSVTMTASACDCSGVRPLKDADTLQDVLDAPDCEELLAWVRSQPLAHFEDGVLFVHAGVLPPWTVEQTLSLADEVHRSLAADDDNAFCARCTAISHADGATI